MELDQLKSVWKRAHDQKEAGYWISEDNMKTMIHENSRATIADVVRQIKRKIRSTGLVGGMAFLLGLFVLIRGTNEPDFFLWLDGWQYGIMMLLMASTILFIHFHSRWRLKQIRLSEQFSGSIKEAMLNANTTFRKVINAGVWSDTTVTPTVLLYVIGISLYEDQAFALDYRLFIMLGIAVGGSLIFYHLGRYMLNRKFGQYLKLLEQRTRELEELEAED